MLPSKRPVIEAPLLGDVFTVRLAVLRLAVRLEAVRLALFFLVLVREAVAFFTLLRDEVDFFATRFVARLATFLVEERLALGFAVLFAFALALTLGLEALLRTVFLAVGLVVLRLATRLVAVRFVLGFVALLRLLLPVRLLAMLKNSCVNAVQTSPYRLQAGDVQ